MQCIFNTAMTIEDKGFIKQSEQSFNRVLAPKQKVANNCDLLSRTLCYPLQYFVMFSSISSGIGIKGQTNYGYANSSLDSICENRHRNGLHGLAIQWGPIDEVGYVARLTDKKIFIGTKIRPQSVSSCLNVLDKLMQCDQVVVRSYLYDE